ncbi:thermonuclease family protein [Brucella anthropi]|uniref:thermonuclease family protein n=1 Tax=Brucella anthropi TaxID=529 RepID=UPI003F7404F3
MFRYLFAAAVALLLTVGLAVAEQSPGSVSGTARVIDGDTISIRQHRVRIAAIDACEKEQRGLLNGKTWPCGLVARSYLRKMIDGKHVSCRIVDVDRYNRSVGQCFIENKDIGLAMVRAGQAEAMLRYLPPNHGIDIAGYGYAENDARERLLGIWAADVESPHLYRRAHTSR